MCFNFDDEVLRFLRSPTQLEKTGPKFGVRQTVRMHRGPAHRWNPTARQNPTRTGSRSYLPATKKETSTF
jgi:hypothetical protein